MRCRYGFIWKHKCALVTQQLCQCLSLQMLDKAYTKRVLLVSIHHICVSLSKFKLLLSKPNYNSLAEGCGESHSMSILLQVMTLPRKLDIYRHKTNFLGGSQLVSNVLPQLSRVKVKEVGIITTYKNSIIKGSQPITRTCFRHLDKITKINHIYTSSHLYNRSEGICINYILCFLSTFGEHNEFKPLIAVIGFHPGLCFSWSLPKQCKTHCVCIGFR